MIVDPIHEPVEDRGPDRGLSPLAYRQPGHVLHRSDDGEIKVLPHPRVHHRHGPARAVLLTSAKERGDAIERRLRRREADSDRRDDGQRLHALQEQRDEAPALGRRHGVDLVHDDVAHRAQHLPRPN